MYTRWYISPRVLDSDGAYISRVQDVLRSLPLTGQEISRGEKLACVNYNRPGADWTVTKVLAPDRHHKTLATTKNVVGFDGKLLSDPATVLNVKLRSFLSSKNINMDDTRDTVGDVLRRVVRWHGATGSISTTRV